MKKTIVTISVLLALQVNATEHKELTACQVDSITESYFDHEEKLPMILTDVAEVTEHVAPLIANNEQSNNLAHIVGCGLTILGVIIRWFEKRALEKKIRREEKAKAVQEWADHHKVNY
jgi:hypothetical protein